MTLRTVEGHTFDAARLRPGCLILDAGCRGFNFANEIKKCGSYAVVPLDPDPAVWDAESARPWAAFRHAGEVALVASAASRVYVGSGEAGHLTAEGPGLAVRTTTMIELLKAYWRFGLVKLDIEGSEYEVLLSWPGPIADQISVEFHEHMGWGSQVHGVDIYERIAKHLGRWYDRVTDNLMDSLWVLR